MGVPGFTSEASLGRTLGRYRTSGSANYGEAHRDQFLTPAYGPSSHAPCDDCLSLCLEIYGICFAGSLLWPPGQVGCFTEHLACTARCELGPACCPKRCTFEFGEGRGCCDADEQCVDINSPNTRTAGCCPSDQVVCSGECCPKGGFCCDGTCCPAGYFCRDGLFCEREFIGRFPTTPPPTPPPPLNKWCVYFGGTSCGRGCCPRGTECCGVLDDGRPNCMTNCLH